MLKHRKSLKAIAFTIIFIFILFVFNGYTGHVSGQVQPIEEVEGKIQEISEVEKAVLEDLFTLSQEIDTMEKREEQINQQLEILQSDMDTLSGRIEQNQQSYEQQREVLKKVLVNYQKRGPASYLGTFLSAGDLTTFLKSLNLLKDISRNSDKLLQSINQTKEQLEDEKAQLSEKELLVQKNREELEKAINDMLVLKGEQEKILASLSDQRQTFEKELNYIENMWDELKVLFSNIIYYFNTIIQRGNLPLDRLDVKLEFPKIRVTLPDEVINDVLAAQPDLPKLIFRFHPDVIEGEVPEKQLSLKCHYVIEEKSSTTFVIDEGSFYGMPLTQGSINELLADGSLKIDFKDILGGIVTIESVETFEGYMDILIAPLF